MLRLRLILALFAPAVVLAQLGASDNGGFWGEDVSQECQTGACADYNTTASVCLGIIENNADDDTAALNCICQPAFFTALQTCGDCILADPNASQSGELVESLAIEFSTACNISLTLQNANDDTKQALAAVSATATAGSGAATETGTSTSASSDSSASTGTPTGQTTPSATPTGAGARLKVAGGLMMAGIGAAVLM